jgi:N utilization substance protein B
MGTRRKAREATLQFLFQDDFSGCSDVDEQSFMARFEQFCGLYQVSRKARPYTVELLRGIRERIDDIDMAISGHATNWRLERIAGMDRNLLRIGIYELLYCDDVPPQVAINEAVEIAKRFGSEESPAFINGVLDAVRHGAGADEAPDDNT